jgi:hypothetical protein
VRVPVAAALALAVLTALVAAGCEDIRRFEGDWAGEVSADPAHRQGFPPGGVLRVTVLGASRRDIRATVQLPATEAPLPYQPIRHAADDVLADLRLEGEPLRTFLGYLRPPTGEPYLAVISLYSEDRIDVRIIRGPEEIYGVFALRRVPPRL